MTITIRDVAQHAKVGVGTVSRVINRSAAVSTATRERVLASIRALDFHPNRSAQSLSHQKTKTIVVILPFFTFPFFVKILESIHRVTEAANYDLVIQNVDTPQKCAQHLQNVLQSRRFDGTILVSLQISDETVATFKNADLPVVLIDSYHAALPSAYINNRQGGFLATTHLLSLGHTHVAYLGDRQNSGWAFVANEQRLAGYQDALQMSGITLQTAYIYQSDRTAESVANGIQHWLTMELPPSAIFAYSDQIALLAIQALLAAGRRIPIDMSIVGFDDIELAQYANLSTIHQPIEEMGRWGAETLLAQLRGEYLHNPSSPTFPLIMISRQTTSVLQPLSLFKHLGGNVTHLN